MWQLESDCHFTVIRFTTDEADWTDNDKFVRVLVQTHSSTNADFDL